MKRLFEKISSAVTGAHTPAPPSHEHAFVRRFPELVKVETLTETSFVLRKHAVLREDGVRLLMAEPNVRVTPKNGFLVVWMEAQGKPHTALPGAGGGVWNEQQTNIDTFISKRSEQDRYAELIHAIVRYVDVRSCPEVRMDAASQLFVGFYCSQLWADDLKPFVHKLHRIEIKARKNVLEVSLYLRDV